MNLPNRLTVFRLILVPVFVALISFDWLGCYVLAFLVFTVATITDYYDGKIARERNLVTNFGKLWDPVADKVLITAAFIMLMTMPELDIPGWTVIAVIGREFLVTGARSQAAADGLVIAANRYGKMKTILQMTYVFTFFALAILQRVAEQLTGTTYFPEVLHAASLWAIVAVAAYTVYSGVQFARANWATLRLGRSI